jgi:hypothetical protein
MLSRLGHLAVESRHVRCESTYSASVIAMRLYSHPNRVGRIRDYL